MTDKPKKGNSASDQTQKEMEEKISTAENEFEKEAEEKTEAISRSQELDSEERSNLKDYLYGFMKRGYRKKLKEEEEERKKGTSLGKGR